MRVLVKPGLRQLCCLDQLHGLSSLDGQLVDRSCCKHQLLEAGHLNDHAGHLGRQSSQVLLREGALIWCRLQNQIDVGVDELTDQLALACLVYTHELRALQYTSQGLLVVQSDVRLLRASSC